MNTISRRFVSLGSTILGAALAGPGGALLGALTGGVISATLPELKPHMHGVVDNIVGAGVSEAAGRLLNRLSREEKVLIHTGLRDALLEALREAVYDVGGRACFPAAWNTPRDVPELAVYPLAAGRDLWERRDPLAAQVYACLADILRALKNGRALAVLPTHLLGGPDAGPYLSACTHADMAALFYNTILSPILLVHRPTFEARPEFEQHLQRYLYERCLVHLGQGLRQRPPAWCAFNQLVIEDLRARLDNLGQGQAELGLRVRHIVGLPGPQAAAWADLTAQMLSHVGSVEKYLDDPLDQILALAAARCEPALQELLPPPQPKPAPTYQSPSPPRPSPQPARSPTIKTAPLGGDAPYVGLYPYRENQSARFFGRDKEAARLASLLAEAPSVVLSGPSGSGKTSLLRAGVIPLLRSTPQAGATDTRRWQIEWLAPTAQPLSALARVLAPTTPPAEIEALAADLRRDPAALQTLVRLRLKSTNRPHLLLVVDPLEDLLSLCPDPGERQAFIDALLPAQPDLFSVIMALDVGSDYYARCFEIAGLPGVLERFQVILEPFSPAALRQVIEEPARLGGWRFEPGLVEHILKEASAVTGESLPPLLSHTLLAAWQNRRGREITFESYAESGGLRGSIANTGERALSSLPPQHHPLARQILVALSPGAGQAAPRLRLEDLAALPGVNAAQPAAASTAPIQEVLQTLQDARLLNTGENGLALTYPLLPRTWPRLRAWLEEEQARPAAPRTTPAPPPTRKRAAPALRLSTRQRALLAALALLILLLAVLGLVDYFKHAAAQARASSSPASFSARQLAEESLARQDDPALAWLLLDEAARQDQDHSPFIQYAQLEMLERYGDVQAVLPVQRAAAGAPAAAGRWLLSGGQDGAVQLWDLDTSHPAGAALLLPEPCARLAIDPTARHAAAGGQSGSLAVIDAATLELQKISRAHTASVLALGFAGPGLLVSIGADGKIIRQEVQDQNSAPREIAALGAPLSAAALDGSAALAAAAGPDGSITLWETAAGQRLGLIDPEAAAPLAALALSPDGSLLASANLDGVVRLWDVRSRQPRGPALLGVGSGARTLAFSPGGAHLAAGTHDGSVWLWSLTGELPEGRALRLHRQPVEGLAFAPDGQTLFSFDASGTGYRWRVDRPRALARDLPTRGGDVAALAVRLPDGLLATGGADGRVALRSADGPLLHHLGALPGAVTTLQFSPHQQMLVAGSETGGLALWSLAQGEDPKMYGYPSGVPASVLAFEQEQGQRLAVGAPDGHVLLWDTQAHAPEGPSMQIHQGRVTGLLFRGRTVISAGADGLLALWDVETGEVSQLARLQVPITALAGGPLPQAAQDLIFIGLQDGQVAQIALPPAASSLALLPSPTPRGSIIGLALRPDGLRLASLNSDGQVLIWDLAQAAAAPQAPSFPTPGDLRQLAWHPNGYLLAANASGGLLAWDVEPLDWHALACRAANREFTLQEWILYFPTLPYHPTCQ